MKIAMFAKMLEHLQQSTLPIPKSRSYTLNSSRKNQYISAILLYHSHPEINMFQCNVTSIELIMLLKELYSVFLILIAG